MKKVISILLTAVLSLQFIPFVFAEASSNVKLSKEANTLGKLGIMTVEDPAKEITRGEFIEVISDFCGYIDSAVTVNEYFYDVYPGHSSERAVAFAANMGLIKGDGGAFRPDDIITGAEAGIVLLRVLGYKYLEPTVSLSSLPANNGILEGVSCGYTGKMNYNDAAIAIYNMMCSEMLTIESITKLSGGTGIFKDTVELATSEIAALEYYKDIIYGKGLVSDNGYTAINGTSSVFEEQMVIGGVAMTKPDDSVIDLIGRTLEVFYIEDEGENIILAYNDITEADDIITIPAADVIDVIVGGDNNAVLKYDKGNSTKSMSLTKPFVIYNGKALLGNEYQTVNLVPQIGEITLIKTTGSSYDLMLVTSMRNCVVENIYVDDGDYTFTDINSMANNLVLTEEKIEESVRLMSITGKRFDFSEIKVGDVLSIAESMDGKRIDVVVSRATISGTVGNISSNGEVTIDGKEYKIGQHANAVEIVAGADGIFYLDGFENIAYYQAGDSAMRFGVLKYAYSEETDGYSLVLKIYDQNGKFNVYNAGKTVKVDGVVRKNAEFETLANELNAVTNPDKMIAFSATSDNVIKTIDTINSGTNDEYDTFRRLEMTEKIDRPETFAGIPYYEWSTNSSAFDGRLFVDGSTKCFWLPVDGEEEDYMIRSKSNFSNERKYPITAAYTLSREGEVAEALSLSYQAKYIDDPSKNPLTYPSIRPWYMQQGLITDVVTAVDDKGEVVHKVTLFRLDNGSTSTYTLRWAEQLPQCEIGRVVLYQEYNGKIYDIEWMLDLNDMSTGTPRRYSNTVNSYTIGLDGRYFVSKNATDSASISSADTRYGLPWRIMVMDVLSVKDKVFTGYIGNASDASGDALTMNPKRQKFLTEKLTKIYRYEAETNTLKQTNLGALVAYEATGDECSKVLLVEKSYSAYVMLIID